MTSEITHLVSSHFSYQVLLRVAKFNLFPSRLMLISILLTFGFDNESKNFLLSPLGLVSF